MIHDDPALSTSENNLWLEVRRGQTRAPRRAVHTRRFLIGGGSNCQLQLGGDDVPILHSILLVDEDGAQIDAVVPTPELFVNGVPHRAARLCDGDVLTIGKFELAVHIQQPVDAGAAEEPGRPAAASEVNLEADLTQLSAAAIVERLEQELRAISALQSGRELGAAALLEAASRTGREGQSEEAVLLQLQELSISLRDRVDHALGRETGGDERPALQVTADEETAHRKAS